MLTCASQSGKISPMVLSSQLPASPAPRKPKRRCRSQEGLGCAALFLACLTQSIVAQSAFEMVPPSRSSLPEPQPLDIVKGVPVFASPSPSPSPNLEKSDPGTGKVEVRGYSATTPDAPIEPSTIYRSALLPRRNDNPATAGHHRTLVGFYAIKPFRESVNPRRLRFEIRLEVPDEMPRESVIEVDSPADGKIRAIPAHISLPISRLTRPGKYTMSWTVTDQQSGDWDTASASFSKANVEKVADVDPRRVPPPAPKVKARPDNFVTAPPTPKPKDDRSRFITTPVSPKTPGSPGSSHQGFKTKSDDESPPRPDGFRVPTPTPKK